jgi:hypothetical protein
MLKIPLVQPAPTRMVAIKRSDDLFVVERKGCQVFFARERNGDIDIIWEDPHVEVTSLGSAKQRRALYTREAAARRKQRRALYARKAAAKGIGKLRRTPKKAAVRSS